MKPSFNIMFSLAPMSEQQPIDIALRLAEAKGWNQTTLAAAVGASSADISNWKKRGLPANKLLATADALEVSVDALLGRKGLSTVGTSLAPAHATRELTELLHSLTVIAGALAKADKSARAAVAPLLSMLGDDPAETGLIARRIAFLIQPSVPGQKSPEDAPAKPPAGRSIRANLEEANDGSSNSAREEEQRRSGAGGPSGGDAG